MKFPSEKQAEKKWFSREVFIWSLFDFANSSFAVIIVAFVYAVYFRKVVTSDLPIGDFYWSVSINISMIIVALLAPVLGAAADFYSNKKKYLLLFTFVCIIPTALLFFVGEGMIAAGMILFIMANIGFQGGLGFYDAFIKEIAEPEFYNKVSSTGYAVGYAGSLFSLGIIFIFQDVPVYTFPACSVMFLIFSLPFFFLIKEKKSNLIVPKPGIVILIRTGYKRVCDTFRHIRTYSNLKNYLLAYFLYIDGVNTIIFFSAIYAQTTLGFSIPELISFFVIVQITALAGSLLLGTVADKTGVKRTLILILICWMIITTSVFLSESKQSFLIIGGLAGLFLGSAQALSRSLMTYLTPEEKKTEFFGFYSLFEKTSTILGPLVFGVVSWLTGNQKYAVISIVIFFMGGLLLLGKVKIPENKKALSK